MPRGVKDDRSRRADNLGLLCSVGCDGRENVGNSATLKVKLGRSSFVGSGGGAMAKGLNLFRFAEHKQSKEHGIDSDVQLGSPSELQVKHSSFRIERSRKTEIRPKDLNFSNRATANKVQCFDRSRKESRP